MDALPALLASLPVDGTGRGRIEGWDIEPVTGGAYNRLYRARRGRDDVAIKFAVRDERNRAGREYAALELLAERGTELAPCPLLLDRHSYARPVVVQGWLDGDAVVEAPESDQEWQDWLEYLSRLHAVAPLPSGPSLPGCWSNGNGADGYMKELASLQSIARTEALPAETTRLIDRLSCLRLDAWEPAAERLCRADYNVRNFIRTPSGLRSVDWEYSGWGDPAEDLAEMMSHVTYMRVPLSRWPWVLDTYAKGRGGDVVEDRVRICLAIKIVGWAVRLARSQGKTMARGEWRANSKEKYEYYLQRAESDELVDL